MGSTFSTADIVYCALSFAVGVIAGLVLAGGRRRFARRLLAAHDAQRKAETEALLDGVKTAFRDVSGDSLRRASDDLVRLSQVGFGAERRLHSQQLAAERAEYEARIGVVL